MVRHIVLYDIVSGLTDKEKSQVVVQIKSALEGLNGLIPGLVELNVYSNLFDSSNADVVLFCVFENIDALNLYKNHPAHLKVADEVVRPMVVNRRCVDFEI